MQRIFRAGWVSELVYNLMGVMNTHGRLKVLDQVLTAYAELLDEQLGNVEVDVTTGPKPRARMNWTRCRCIASGPGDRKERRPPPER